MRPARCRTRRFESTGFCPAGITSSNSFASASCLVISFCNASRYSGGNSTPFWILNRSTSTAPYTSFTFRVVGVAVAAPVLAASCASSPEAAKHPQHRRKARLRTRKPSFCSITNPSTLPVARMGIIVPRPSHLPFFLTEVCDARSAARHSAHTPGLGTIPPLFGFMAYGLSTVEDWPAPFRSSVPLPSSHRDPSVRRATLVPNTPAKLPAPTRPANPLPADSLHRVSPAAVLLPETWLRACPSWTDPRPAES